jgi:hypothetical protein
VYQVLYQAWGGPTSKKAGAAQGAHNLWGGGRRGDDNLLIDDKEEQGTPGTGTSQAWVETGGSKA